MPTFNNGFGDDFLATLGVAPPALETSSLPTKALGYAIQAPLRAVGGLVQSAGNLLGIPEADAGMFTDAINPSPSEGFGALMDVAGAGLAPALIQLGVGGAAIKPLMRAAGAGRATTAIAQDALGFGMLGLQEDRLTGLEQAGEGAGYGLTRLLPSRTARAVPAALLAYLSKAFYDRAGETPIIPGSDFSRGDVSGLLGFGTAFLPGRLTPGPLPRTADQLAIAAKETAEAARTRGIVEETRAQNLNAPYDPFVPPGAMPLIQGTPAPEFPAGFAPGRVPIDEAAEVPRMFGPAYEGPMFAGGPEPHVLLGLPDPNMARSGRDVAATFLRQPEPVAPSPQQLLGFPAPIERRSAADIAATFARAEGNPLEITPGGNLQLDELLGIGRVPRSAEEAAAVIKKARDKADQAVTLEFFREQRGYPTPAPRGTPRAGYTPPELRPGYVPPAPPAAPVVVPPLPEMPLQLGYTPPGPGRQLTPQELFDPAMFEQIRAMGINPAGPEAQHGMQELQMILMMDEVRGNRQLQEEAFHNFFVNLVNRSPALENVAPVANPLAEGDVLGPQSRSRIQPLSQAELQTILPEAQAQSVSRMQGEVDARVAAEREAGKTARPMSFGPIPYWEQNEILRRANEARARKVSAAEGRADARAAAEREAAARGKVHPFPESQGPNIGGFADMDTLVQLGLASARGVGGYTLGTMLGNARPDDDLDPQAAAIALAALGVAGPFAPRILAAVAKSAENVASARKVDQGRNYLIGSIMTDEAFRLNYRMGVREGIEQGLIAPHSYGYEITAKGADAFPSPSGMTRSTRMSEAGSILPEGTAPVPEHPVLKKIDDGNIVYDGEGTVLKNSHQFTIYDESLKAHGQTFYIKGDPTPESVAAAYNNTLTRYGDEPLPPFREAGSTPADRSGEAGFVTLGTSAAVSRASLGSLMGGVFGAQTDEDGERGGLITGMIAGAMAGALGPAMARSLISKIGDAPVQQAKPGTKLDAETIARNIGTLIEEKSGAALRGSEKATDRFVRWLDSRTELTLPPVVKNTLLKAKGLSSNLLDQMDTALLKMSARFTPDAELAKLTNQYLDGGVPVNQYLDQVAAKYAGNQDAVNYSNFAVTARESINGLQKMIAEGIGDPKMRKIIEDSINSYVTKSYKLYAHPSWKPSDEQLHNLTGEILRHKIWPGATYDDIHTFLEQYVREVKTIKGAAKFSGNPIGQAIYHAINPDKTLGQSISQGPLKERVKMSAAWKDFLGEITDPTERIYQTVYRIRPMAEASKYFADLTKVTDKGLPQVFQSYADKDAFMGGILQRLQKSNPPHQRLGEIVNEYMQSSGQRAGLRRELMAILPDSPDNKEIIRQLTNLDSYQNVMKHPKFGELGGQIVSHHVWDTLQTYDSLTDVMNHPWLRSIAGAHTAIKLAKTALSPIQIVRQFVTMPTFMAIARANPHDIPEAWRIIQNGEHPLRAEIMKQGIANVDQVKTEFFKEFQTITGGTYNFGSIDMANLGMGKYDLDMLEKYGRRGFRKILDVYRLPDNLVRISSYISAKRRIAQELGVGMDDPRVLEEATNFVNRYTMNYDAIIPLVKSARQTPLVNMFISYQAEMARLAKNLVLDVAQGNQGSLARHGRLYAAVPLAALAALPELLQSASESELSPQDRIEWEKTKRLLPDYGRNRYRVGVSRGKDGQFSYLDVTPLVASDSMNQMVRALASGDEEAALAVNPVLGWENTPALNLVMAQAQGKDLRTKREFRYGTQGYSDRFAAAAKEVLPSWFPGVGSEATKFQQAYRETESGERGTTDMRTGRRLTPSDFWYPYFTGMQKGTFNPTALQKRAEAEAKREVANVVMYANDILKSDANQELKQKVAEEARLAIAVIRENYRARIEGEPDRSLEASSGPTLPRR